MNEIIIAIRSLVERLAAMPLNEQCIEAQALALLTDLEGEIAARNTSSMARCHAQLNAFWMQRVPWCSSLSKELEKLIIQMEEHLQEPHR